MDFRLANRFISPSLIIALIMILQIQCQSKDSEPIDIQSNNQDRDIVIIARCFSQSLNTSSLSPLLSIIIIDNSSSTNYTGETINQVTFINFRSFLKMALSQQELKNMDAYIWDPNNFIQPQYLQVFNASSQERESISISSVIEQVFIGLDSNLSVEIVFLHKESNTSLLLLHFEPFTNNSIQYEDLKKTIRIIGTQLYENIPVQQQNKDTIIKIIKSQLIPPSQEFEQMVVLLFSNLSLNQSIKTLNQSHFAIINVQDESKHCTILVLGRQSFDNSSSNPFNLSTLENMQFKVASASKLSIRIETFINNDSNQTSLMNYLQQNNAFCNVILHNPVPDEEYNLLFHCFDDTNLTIDFILFQILSNSTDNYVKIQNKSPIGFHTNNLKTNRQLTDSNSLKSKIQNIKQNKQRESQEYSSEISFRFKHRNLGTSICSTELTIYPGSCCGICQGSALLGQPGSQCGRIGVVDPVNYDICSLGPINAPSVPLVSVYRVQSVQQVPPTTMTSGCTTAYFTGASGSPYMTQSGGTLTFSPLLSTPPGTISISYSYTDGYTSQTFVLSTVTILDQHSIFTSGSPINQQVTVGQSLTYDFSSQISDAESDIITSSVAGNPSFMTLSSHVLTITFCPWTQGPSAPTVIITLFDTYFLSIQYPFTLTIINTPPVIVPLVTQTAQVQFPALPFVIYPITVTDPEGSPLLTVTASGLACVTLLGQIFTLAPIQSNVAGTFPITVTAFDGAVTASSSFNVIILNNIPTFDAPLIDKTICRGNRTVYPISVSDPDGFSVIVTYSPFKSYISVQGHNLIIAPQTTNPIETTLITVTLFDGAMYAYSVFKVIVINNPPYFVTIPVNQTAYIGTFIKYQLPQTFDPQGTLVTFTYSTLPDFVSFVGPQYFGFSATLTDKTIAYPINITLYDQCYAPIVLAQYYGCSTVLVIMNVTVVLPPQSAAFKLKLASLMNISPPHFTQNLTNLIIQQGQTLSYTLPNIFDPDNDKYDISVNLENAYYFTNYNDGVFTFQPLLYQTETNITYQIHIILRDHNIFYPKSSKNILCVSLLGISDNLQINQTIIVNKSVMSNKTVPVTNSTIQITKCSRDGKLTLRVDSPRMPQMIANLMNEINTIIKIQNKSVQFNITSSNQSISNIVEIQLILYNPQYISISQVSTIAVQFFRNLILLRLSQLRILFLTQNNIRLQCLLDQEHHRTFRHSMIKVGFVIAQHVATIKMMQQIKTTIYSCTIALIPVGLFLNIFLQFYQALKTFQINCTKLIVGLPQRYFVYDDIVLHFNQPTRHCPTRTASNLKLYLLGHTTN